MGYLANYLYYGGNGPMMVAVTWTLGALATFVVILRFFSRIKVVKEKGGWSLFWALVSYCHAVTASSLYTVEALYGDFNHLSAVATDPYLAWVTELDWITANIVNFAALYGKFSAAAFIFGIIGPTRPWARRCIIALLVVATSTCIIMIALIFSQCDPPSKLWDATMAGHCDPERRLFAWAVFTASWGALTDLTLATYPMYLVARMQKDWRKKILASILMGMGIFTAVCSVIKAVHFAGLELANDVTFIRAVLCLFGVIEMWVVLIASGLAPLWPLVQRYIIRSEQTPSHSEKPSSYNRPPANSSSPTLGGNSAPPESSHGSLRAWSTSSPRKDLPPRSLTEYESGSSVYLHGGGNSESNQAM